jgi:hypothetical protein
LVELEAAVMEEFIIQLRNLIHAFSMEKQALLIVAVAEAERVPLADKLVDKVVQEWFS